MENPGDRLDSWKEIADYLGRDRTTVMRWERTASLPVRRIPGDRGRSVFAYKADIDRWLAATPTSPEDAAPANGQATDSTPPRAAWKFVAGGATAALLLVVSAAALSRLAVVSPVASVGLVGRDIVAADSGGREVWRHILPHVEGSVFPARFVVNDLDEDGRPEVLAALLFMQSGRQDQGVVLLFDDRGRVRWERSLEDRYRFGGEEYGPAWFPDDILVYRAAGNVRIAVAFHHHTWWPGVVVTYSASGEPVARFVNSGWITSLNMSADSRYLLAAGISNSFRGAVLTALDSSRPSGVSPTEAGSLPPCANCPEGRPAAYFVAPWTELARPSDTPAISAQVVPSGLIEWRAAQRAPDQGDVPEVIVTLSPALKVLSRSVNDHFSEMRLRLERAGLLDASQAWRAPSVMRWTAAAGWEDIPAGSTPASRRR